MSRLLSLLFVILFAFDVSLVAARPKSLQHRSISPPNLDTSRLDTNAKRFTAGYPPLPPLLKRRPTNVATAKRSVVSQCAKSGIIQVSNANTGALLGYLSKALVAGQRYGLATSQTNAGTFSSSVFVSGQTSAINIRDVTDGTHFLAGIIMRNQPLGDGSNDNKAAILGRSFATNPGDPPQANKDPSINNRDVETAIWTYDRADNSLTAAWVNYVGQIPATTTAYISYLSSGTKFYLTGTASQNGTPVVFKFISVDDQCCGSASHFLK